jgi:RNA polymerase sigma-70 factor, ECF subfamily
VDGHELLRDHGAAVQEAIFRAARANPSLGAPPDGFVSYLAARLVADADPAESLAEMRVEQLYLAFACAAGERKAIVRFEAEHFHHVPVAMARFRMSDTNADEIRQRLRERLLVAAPGKSPRITEYSGRGDLGSWVRAVAMRLVIDALRASGKELPADEETFAELAVADEDLELGHSKREYAAAFRAALREAMRGIDPERRMELKLYYLEGVTLEDLGALFRVAPSTIARRLGRSRETLLARTREVLRRELQIGESEVGSVLALIESRMDLAGSAFDLTSGGTGGTGGSRTRPQEGPGQGTPRRARRDPR